MSRSETPDWSRYTDEVRALELALQKLLETTRYARDDRRLARVYLLLARQARALMTEEQQRYLNLIDRWGYRGDVPEELLAAPAQLSALASQSEADEGSSAMRPFLYRLLESCARPAFTIHVDTDIDPIGWIVAIGVPFEEVRQAVSSEYPELTMTS